MAAPRSEEGLPDGTEMQTVRKATFGLIFTQMSAKTGIKKHGQAAVDALRKEFEPFRSMDVLEPWTLSNSPRNKRPSRFGRSV